MHAAQRTAIRAAIDASAYGRHATPSLPGQMSSGSRPDQSGPITAQRIAEAEREIGAALEQHVAGYIAVARELTDLAGRMVAHVDGPADEPRAVHSAAVILARIVTELQAVVHLVRMGYPAQALTLTGTMVELFHTTAYVGSDEKRAAAWFAHDDPRKSYPGSLKKTMREVSDTIGALPEVFEREYNTIYQKICMVKHANSMIFGHTTVVATDDTAFVVVGPHLSESIVCLAHAAMQYGVRYTMLAVIAFVKHHLPDERRDPYWPEIKRLSERTSELVAETATQYPREGETTVRT